MSEKTLTPILAPAEAQASEEFCGHECDHLTGLRCALFGRLDQNADNEVERHAKCIEGEAFAKEKALPKPIAQAIAALPKAQAIKRAERARKAAEAARKKAEAARKKARGDK